MNQIAKSMAPAAASNLQGQGPAANIAEVTEYFPLGPVTSASRSFLRLRLNGDCRELFVLRQAGVAPALFCRASWPKALRARLFPSADEDVRRVWGVALLRAAPPEPYTVSDLHRSLSEDLGTDLGQQGTAFVPGPWSSTCRVKGVAEHCRPARLGFWGWLFRLKHSVLAVRLQCPDAATEDLLYLDKNADVGVSWRRAGFLERFAEAPRTGYSWDVDLDVQTFWDAVAATKAFKEAQEVSNCQHFVRECLEELSHRGHLQAGNLSLRNQEVADWLHTWGYLDESRKAPDTGSDHARRLFGMAMSWGLKLGAARWGSPWAEHFVLEPTDRKSVV